MCREPASENRPPSRVSRSGAFHPRKHQIQWPAILPCPADQALGRERAISSTRAQSRLRRARIARTATTTRMNAPRPGPGVVRGSQGPVKPHCFFRLNEIGPVEQFLDSALPASTDVVALVVPLNAVGLVK